MLTRRLECTFVHRVALATMNEKRSRMGGGAITTTVTHVVQVLKHKTEKNMAALLGPLTRDSPRCERKTSVPPVFHRNWEEYPFFRFSGITPPPLPPPHTRLAKTRREDIITLIISKSSKFVSCLGHIVGGVYNAPCLQAPPPRIRTCIQYQ